MRVRALKGFRHRVTGRVVEGAVLDIDNRELAESLVEGGWVAASKAPADVVVEAAPAVDQPSNARPTKRATRKG